jgi:hypothetical protein
MNNRRILLDQLLTHNPSQLRQLSFVLIPGLREHTNERPTISDLAQQLIEILEQQPSGIDKLKEAMRLTLREVEHVTADPRAFYTGGMVTKADIAAGLDVPRTRYTSNWMDEKNVQQESWKKRLFAQADATLSQKTVRVVVVYEHSGSGKTTLCRRMAYDLEVEKSIPVVPRFAVGLREADVSEITFLAYESSKCVHVFTKIEDVLDKVSVHEVALAITKLRGEDIPVCVYIAIDTNKWKQIEHHLSTIRRCGCTLEQRHLYGQLDTRELNDLIFRLKKHDCLFRLRHKDDSIIQRVFARKAKKGLLTSLIEATRGTDDAEKFEDIIWREYFGLTPSAQWAYGIVTVFAAFSIWVPQLVMERLLNKPVGHGYYKSTRFASETAELVRFTGAEFTSRHRLISETLVDRLVSGDETGTVNSLLEGSIEILDLSDVSDAAFFQEYLERKVLKLYTMLECFLRRVKTDDFLNIQGEYISRVLNSATRIYQGRREYEQAKGLAEDSVHLWGHHRNPARYLRGYSYYHLGQRPQALRVANDLVEMSNPPLHILYGVRLLVKLQEWQMAQSVLSHFETSDIIDVDLFPDYYTLKQDVRLGRILQWNYAVDISSLKPKIALDMIARIASGENVDDERIIEEYKRLTRRQHAFFQAYVAFFSYIWETTAEQRDKERRIVRYRIVQEECDYHLSRYEEGYNYPAAIRSILHASRARALFKMDYALGTNYTHKEMCAAEFRKAIELIKDNGYAHNWYGTFLKEVEDDREGANNNYIVAVNSNKEYPCLHA